jgi:putative thioredoxin
MSERIVDVGDRDFEQQVVERSRQVPVVVDFWAAWCGPCRALGPLLERLAEEFAGAFVLAKVDVDRNPQVAAAFGVRSIPMVLGFRDAQIVSEFVGALPESEVREFIARVLPSAADRAATEGAELHALGKLEEAEQAFRRALDLDARSDRALLGLASVLADRHRDSDALASLERIAPGSPVRQEADRLAAELRVRQAGSVDESTLRQRVMSNPDDLEARFALAQALAARGVYEAALEGYLAIVRRDRQFRDDAARKAMLDVFELLGAGSEVAERYRSELAKVLFS